MLISWSVKERFQHEIATLHVNIKSLSTYYCVPRIGFEGEKQIDPLSDFHWQLRKGHRHQLVILVSKLTYIISGLTPLPPTSLGRENNESEYASYGAGTKKIFLVVRRYCGTYELRMAAVPR